MLSHLLSELPATRAADWKCWSMSVCIAGIANGGKEIVLVSDSKAAFGDFSADGAVRKIDPLFAGYVIQFAGNDPARAGAIIRRAKKRLEEIDSSGKRLPADQVAECVFQECQLELQRVQEAKVLKKHGYSYELFTSSGKDICTDSVFYDLHSELGQTKLSLDFLVAGFDEKGEGHIRFTNSATPPEDYDSLGFWAIGKGQHSALASLSHAREYLSFVQHSDEETVAYHLFAAKFMAESASDVGKETFALSISARHSIRHLFLEETDYIRAQWKQNGAPRIPKGVKPVLKLLFGRPEEMFKPEYLEAIAKYSPRARQLLRTAKKIKEFKPSTPQKSEPEPNR
jgi:hypothetical protein